MSRLASQKSAYLLEQAGGLVDWFPWGDEAAQKAKAEDKLVFLSIGYSTCHWCHVMDRESFGNKEIAHIMNERYVCVRVDREERPDVDRLYMTFVQAAHPGSGGWPLNVWLTPELKPIYGCSYLPPDDAAAKGRPSLKTLLRRMASKWASEKPALQKSADSIVHALAAEGVLHAGEPEASAVGNGVAGAPARSATVSPAVSPAADLSAGDQWAANCFVALLKQYDSTHGGFGRSPKFPQPSSLSFLFSYYACLKNDQQNESNAKLARDMALKTLRHMAYGGIRDHVGGGFHRYSRDKAWHVPHFEKTLCDQAQLAVMYAVAYQVTDKDFYAEVCHETLDYVTKRLSHPSGGFCSGEDADSLPTPDATEKKEGAFYSWTTEELQKVLSQSISGAPGVTNAEVFMNHYNAKNGGNVDPYQEDRCELDGKNVLYAKHSLEEAAVAYGCVQQEVRDVLSRSRQLLAEALESGAVLKKQRPAVDCKLIAAWNGLMVSALARCSQALHNSRYEERAIAAALFIKDKLYDEHTNSLLRNCYAVGDALVQIDKPIYGFSEDYAFVIRGLLDLYETILDDSWLALAEKLQRRQDELFWDAEHGAYFNSRDNDSLMVARIKEEQDGAEPSASSIAVHNLLRLATITNDAGFQQKAARTLAFFDRHIKEVPMALPELVTARMLYNQGLKQVILCGAKDARQTKALKRTTHETYAPGRVLVWSDRSQQWLNERCPFYATLDAPDDTPTAFVRVDPRGIGGGVGVGASFTVADELETELRGGESQAKSCTIL